MKIIHIGPDSQFIQFISGVFEELAPGANRYLVTGRTSDRRYLKFPVRESASSIHSPGLRGTALIPLYVRSCDMIIAHGMGPQGVVAFLSSPKTTVRVWSGWGFDYYGNDCEPNAGLVTPSTAEIMNIDPIKRNSRFKLNGISRRLLSQGMHKAAKKTDYFSAPIPSDFAVFKRRFPEFRGEYSQLNYGSVDETFAKGGTGAGLNILVGNSATETNNHIDVFKMLAKCDLKLRKVIVPLSYGNDRYRTEMMGAGRAILGDAFFPLVNFLPLEEYSSIISSCNVVVMNHLRQQALGNIGAALYNGAHVFLNPINPAFNFFKAGGAIVCPIEELISRPLPLRALSGSEVQNNRAALEKFWGDLQIRANVSSLIAKIRSREDESGSSNQETDESQ